MPAASSLAPKITRHQTEKIIQREKALIGFAETRFAHLLDQVIHNTRFLRVDYINPDSYQRLKVESSLNKRGGRSVDATFEQDGARITVSIERGYSDLDKQPEGAMRLLTFNGRHPRYNPSFPNQHPTPRFFVGFNLTHPKINVAQVIKDLKQAQTYTKLNGQALQRLPLGACSHDFCQELETLYGPEIEIARMKETDRTEIGFMPNHPYCSIYLTLPLYRFSHERAETQAVLQAARKTIDDFL